MRKKTIAKAKPAIQVHTKLSIQEMFPKTFATLERELVKYEKNLRKEIKDELKNK